MFLPPVGKDEEWTPFLGKWECSKPRKPVTMDKMDDYSRRMNEKGFKGLDYFNVTGLRIGEREAAVRLKDLAGDKRGLLR